MLVRNTHRKLLAALLPAARESCASPTILHARTKAVRLDPALVAWLVSRLHASSNEPAKVTGERGWIKSTGFGVRGAGCRAESRVPSACAQVPGAMKAPRAEHKHPVPSTLHRTPNSELRTQHRNSLTFPHADLDSPSPDRTLRFHTSHDAAVRPRSVVSYSGCRARRTARSNDRDLAGTDRTACTRERPAGARGSR